MRGLARYGWFRTSHGAAGGCNKQASPLGAPAWRGVARIALHLPAGDCQAARQRLACLCWRWVCRLIARPQSGTGGSWLNSGYDVRAREP